MEIQSFVSGEGGISSQAAEQRVAVTVVYGQINAAVEFESEFRQVAVIRLFSELIIW